MVVFAAPKKFANSILVREVLSHSCEWLNSGTENGGVPPIILAMVSSYYSHANRKWGATQYD